jgi:hypothetical protein
MGNKKLKCQVKFPLSYESQKWSLFPRLYAVGQDNKVKNTTAIQITFLASACIIDTGRY